jgi:ribA/ribD-fused uncharacterized protein
VTTSRGRGFLRLNETIKKVMSDAKNKLAKNAMNEMIYETPATIQQSICDGKKIEFTIFSATVSPLSQWYPCSLCDIDYTVYNSAEQFMMAYKANLFKDDVTLKKIMAEQDPATIKQLGRLVQNFDQSIWDEYKVQVVKKANMLKFSQNINLKEHLLMTENKVIVEANPNDNIYSCGLMPDDPLVTQPDHWVGEN